MSDVTLGTSVNRTLGLARFNWLLMVRNRTTMLYAFVMPLVPLGLLFAVRGDEPDPTSGAATIGTALFMALLFPGYYNVLSMFVSRRDEMVLKRLRTGEIRDLELVASMALPGAAITLAVAVLTVPIAWASGLDLPLNPVLLLVAVLLSIVTFAAFAVWTAAWTKTAESAQLTSGPVLLLALAGLMGAALPESWQRWFDLLPGAAVLDLTRIAWFAQDGLDGTAGELSFLETWSHAAPSVGVLVAWTAVAVVLAVRSLRWEPRS